MNLEDLKAKLNKMNGWQRAWIFISGIILLPHLLALYFFFPHDYDYIYIAPADTNRVIIREQKWVDSYREPCEKASTEVFKSSGFVSDDARALNSECNQHIRALNSARSNFDQEAASRSEYRSQVWNVIFYTFLVYGLIIGAIYLAGFGVAWVRKGFTSK